MSLYESVLIARQDISAQQVETLADELCGIVTEHGGTVTKKEFWGLRSLAYRVSKNRKGHYVLFNIDAPSAAVLEMERVMRLNEDILRYMTVRVDALEEGQSAVLQQKGERDQRGPRGPRGPREGGFRNDRGPREDRSPREGGFRNDRNDRAEGGN